MPTTARRSLLGITAVVLLALAHPAHSQEPTRGNSASPGEIAPSSLHHLLSTCRDIRALTDQDAAGLALASEEQLDVFLQGLCDQTARLSFTRRVQRDLLDISQRIDAIDGTCAPPFHANWPEHLRQIQSVLRDLRDGRLPLQDAMAATEARLRVIAASVAYHEAYMARLCSLYRGHHEETATLVAQADRARGALESAIASMQSGPRVDLALAGVPQRIREEHAEAHEFRIYRLPAFRAASSHQRAEWLATLAILERLTTQMPIQRVAEGTPVRQVVSDVLSPSGYMYVEFDAPVPSPEDGARARAAADARRRSLRGASFGRDPNGAFVTLSDDRFSQPTLESVESAAEFLRTNLDVADGAMHIDGDSTQGRLLGGTPGPWASQYELVGDFLLERHLRQPGPQPMRPAAHYLSLASTHVVAALSVECSRWSTGSDEARASFLDSTGHELTLDERLMFRGIFSGAAGETESTETCLAVSERLRTALDEEFARRLETERDAFGRRYGEQFHQMDYVGQHIMAARWVEQMLGPEGDVALISRLREEAENAFRSSRAAAEAHYRDMERLREENEHEMNVEKEQTGRQLEQAAIQAEATAEAAATNLLGTIRTAEATESVAVSALAEAEIDYEARKYEADRDLEEQVIRAETDELKSRLEAEWRTTVAEIEASAGLRKARIEGKTTLSKALIDGLATVAGAYIKAGGE